MRANNSNSQNSQFSWIQSRKQQLIDYFDRFFQTTLKQHISNPIVLSEWIYFCTMLRSQPFDQDRVQLYLGILHNENCKPTKGQPTNSNQKINNQNHGIHITTTTSKPMDYPNKYLQNYSQAPNSSSKARVSLSPSHKSNKDVPLSILTNLQLDRNSCFPDQKNKHGFQYPELNKKISEPTSKLEKPSQIGCYKTVSGNNFEEICLKKTESSKYPNAKGNYEFSDQKCKQEPCKNESKTTLRRLNLDLENRKLTDAAQALLKVFQQTHKTFR